MVIMNLSAGGQNIKNSSSLIVLWVYFCTVMATDFLSTSLNSLFVFNSFVKKGDNTQNTELKMNTSMTNCVFLLKLSEISPFCH